MIVGTLAAVAGFLLALSGVVGAIGLLAKSEYAGRPVRWLWRKNIGEPVGGFFEERVGKVVGEHIEYLMHHRNNGSSLLDLKESLLEARKDINRLLEHDASRDRVGQRYGPPIDLLRGDEAAGMQSPPRR